MNSILIRTICAITAVALLFAGVAFAVDRRQEYRLAAAAHDDAKRAALTQRQAAETADKAMALLDDAQAVFSRLEPAPREWTTFPLSVKAEMDAAQAGHLLRLVGKTEPWSFLRTQTLKLQSKCGLEPCSTFQVDLRAEAYAPEQRTEEPAWADSTLN